MNQNTEINENIEAKVTVDKDNGMMFMECTSKDGGNCLEALLAMCDAMQEAMN